ncbi:MAG: hypothetical protein QNI90_19165 [Dinoroseobacter sp.]|nr:hypothetical protein [Dinoroseobacter sp.]
MAANDHADLIRRKLRGPSPSATALAAGRPELDAMRAAARASYSSAGLKVEMRGSSAEDIEDLSALLTVLNGAMLIVPYRADDAVEGYVALSHEFAQSLIEKATTGALSKQPVEPRQASSIDMLLCRDFLKRFMHAWQEISEGKPSSDWIAGFQPQEQPVDTDLLTLHARDVPFRLFRVELRIEGVRDAQLLTAFPIERHPRREVEVPAPTAPEVDWGKVWRDTVMDTHAALDATLVQVPVPLKDVKRWRPCDLVDIPADALAQVSLGRQGGAVVATARLGQARGYRALCLNTLSRDTSGATILEDATATSAPPTVQETGFDRHVAAPASDFQASGAEGTDGNHTNGERAQDPSGVASTDVATQGPATPESDTHDVLP